MKNQNPPSPQHHSYLFWHFTRLNATDMHKSVNLFCLNPLLHSHIVFLFYLALAIVCAYSHHSH